MNYVTVSHYNQREFDIAVNEKLDQGYRICGSPYSNQRFGYCQGMLKPATRSKKK